MWVEQAVFTSEKTRYGEGYHVTARSPGISRDTVVELTRWSPSHASLQSTATNFSSLNYHPLADGRLVVSRTTYGAKEFSGRGGLQVATMSIVLTQQQFAGYGCHAFLLARVARALGYLRWQPRFAETLPVIELPDHEESESLLKRNIPRQDLPDVDDVLISLRAGKRLAVVEEDRTIVEVIVDRLNESERLRCSYSTGLNASNQRPFQLQTFDRVSGKTVWRLESNGIQIVRLPEHQKIN